MHVQPNSENVHSPGSKEPGKRFVFGLWSLVGLAAILTISALDRPPRCDESISYLEYIRSGPWAIVSTYHAPNNHVFYNLLAWLPSVGFPFSPWAQRLVAWFAGVATIYATGRVAGRFFGERIGLYAAGLVGLNAIHLDYAVNARGYTLVSLFTVWLAGLVWARDRVEMKDRSFLLKMVTGGALGIWMIPTMLFPLAGIYLLGALRCWLRRESAVGGLQSILWLAVIVVLTIGMATLLYLPIGISEGWKALLDNPFVVSLRRDQFVAQLGLLGKGLIALGFGWSPWIGLGLLGAGLGGLLLDFKRSRDVLCVIAVYLLGFLIVAGIVFAVPPGRVLQYLVPVFALWCAVGLAALGRRLPRGLEWGGAGFGMLLAIVTLYANPRVDGAWRHSLPTVGLPSAGAMVEKIFATEDTSSRSINLLSGLGVAPMLAYQLARRETTWSVGFHGEGFPTWVVRRHDDADSLSRLGRMEEVLLPDPSLVVDLETETFESADLLRYPVGSVQYDPQPDPWKDAKRGGAFIRESEWFGKFSDYHFPWLTHEVHGDIRFGGGTAGYFWIWDRALALWWSSGQSEYPWISVGKRQRRKLLVDLSSQVPHRRFWDPITEEWTSEDDLRKEMAELSGSESP